MATPGYRIAWLDAAYEEAYEEARVKITERVSAEVEVQTLARAILTLLRARGLKLTEKRSQRIRSCRDVGQLSSWLEAAATAETTADVFKPTAASGAKP